MSTSDQRRRHRPRECNARQTHHSTCPFDDISTHVLVLLTTSHWLLIACHTKAKTCMAQSCKYLAGAGAFLCFLTIILRIKGIVLWELCPVYRPLNQDLDTLLFEPALSHAGMMRLMMLTAHQQEAGQLYGCCVVLMAARSLPSSNLFQFGSCLSAACLLDYEDSLWTSIVPQDVCSSLQLQGLTIGPHLNMK